MGLDISLIKLQARGQWPSILSTFSINVPHSHTKHGSCPNCGGKDRFRFDDKGGNGSHICSQCGAGDGFSLLMKCFGWNFHQALAAVNSSLGGGSLTPPTRPKPARTTEQINIKRQRGITNLIHQTVPTGAPLKKYLKKRGLSDAADNLPGSLRFHASLSYWEQTKSGYWTHHALCPAMVGLVTNLERKVITLHRTFLTHSGEKAPYENPRKLMPTAVVGSLKGCSVKLSEPADQLCLTEGIETALAVWLSTGIPTWSCVAANLLEAVEVPSNVKKINIMADKDRSLTGQRSAEKLARRLTKLGHSVRVCIPTDEIPNGQKSLDWLDVFNRNKEVAAL